MSDRRSPKRISSVSLRHGSGASFLDAPHAFVASHVNAFYAKIPRDCWRLVWIGTRSVSRIISEWRRRTVSRAELLRLSAAERRELGYCYDLDGESASGFGSHEQRRCERSALAAPRFWREPSRRADESRRRQAAREIDNYRHLLDEAKADEIRRAIEELNRESIPIWSIWRSQISWITLMMNRMRAWMQAARLFASQGRLDL